MPKDNEQVQAQAVEFIDTKDLVRELERRSHSIVIGRIPKTGKNTGCFTFAGGDFVCLGLTTHMAYMLKIDLEKRWTEGKT